MSEGPHVRPSLHPSFPLAYKQTSRVVINAQSPAPHRGRRSRGYLPHWDHPGMIQSLNFRLADAMPQSVLERWQVQLAADSDAIRAAELRRRVDEYLDAGYGACWLRKPEIAELVEAALFHFDAGRYGLLAWCVMPNHVHVVIETRIGFPLDTILHSWKSFTSHRANACLGRVGEFWQREYLDRYVRNAEHYERIINYVEENPVKAALVKSRIDWPWSSARFRFPGSAGVSLASG